MSEPLDYKWAESLDKKTLEKIMDAVQVVGKQWQEDTKDYGTSSNYEDDQDMLADAQDNFEHDFSRIPDLPKGIIEAIIDSVQGNVDRVYRHTERDPNWVVKTNIYNVIMSVNTGVWLRWRKMKSTTLITNKTKRLMGL